MVKRILDTSHLISGWRQGASATTPPWTLLDIARWAQELIRFRGTNAIVTPVYLEFVAGVRSKEELALARAFLAEFEMVDAGRVLISDWKEARRIAERVPRNGKPRHLGDCLIRAIAARLRYDVSTGDQDFPM